MKRKSNEFLSSLIVLSMVLILVIAFSNSLVKAFETKDTNEYMRLSATDTDASQDNTEDNQILDFDEEINLLYDDRYEFDEEIHEIKDLEITSNQTGSDEKDEHVLSFEGGSGNKVCATGCGVALVTTVKGKTYKVTVSPAPISLLLIAGQSNAEGTLSDDAKIDTYKEESILCEEGQVYNTYGSSLVSRGKSIGWFSTSIGINLDNASSFLPKSLTDNSSIYEYQRTNNLTAAKTACGKSGIDSGLGYMWTKMLDEKVWIINAAYAGSSVTSWVPGSKEINNYFWKAVKLYQAAEALLDLEIDAGHYTLSHKGYFWCQGEANCTMDAKTYYSTFLNIHEGFVEQMSGKETKHINKPIEFAGINMVRASISVYNSSEDLYMTGPRMAQYYMCSSNAPENKMIYLASDLEEQWVTDAGVDTYFKNTYGDEASYIADNPMKKEDVSIPSRVEEVHETIHYEQLGYNEVGRDAAKNIIYALGYKEAPLTKASSIQVVNVNGVTSIPSSIALEEELYQAAVVKVHPAYRTKNLKVAVTDGAKYDCQGIRVLTDTAAGTINFTADDHMLSTSFTKGLVAPVIRTCSNTAAGVKITWARIADAKIYYVYRKKITASSWSLLGSTAELCFTDNKAEAGETYNYTVRGRDSAGNLTSYNVNGVLIQRLNAITELKLEDSKGSGTALVWDNVKGATGYYVYRKNVNNGSWAYLASTDNTEDITRYKDTSGEEGVIYNYMVYPHSRSSLGVNSSIKLEVRYSNNLSPVSISTAKASSFNSVNVSWTLIEGAEYYNVYRKLVGGGWKYIGQSVSTSYTDNTGACGTNYIYTVRGGSGSILGGYNNTGVLVKTAACKVVLNKVAQTSVVTTVKGKKVTNPGGKFTWNKYTGATGYYVFRKVSGGGWKHVATTTSNSYLDKNVVKGKTYKYTVRAYIKVNGTLILGAYDTSGKSITIK